MEKKPRLMPCTQGSYGDEDVDSKKPRRSQRLKENAPLPSPVTHNDSTGTEEITRLKHGTSTPPSQIENPLSQYSPFSDTQPFSQFVYPPRGVSYEVEDEEGEGVWGYLVPSDHKFGDVLVLRKRAACPVPKKKQPKQRNGHQPVKKDTYDKEEEQYEKHRVDSVPAEGYLIGRHPECGKSFMIIRD